MSVYAFSDLHAQYDLWDQIKNYIEPNDKVYCLGDCVDRGPAGLDILNEVMATSNIILLKGNHEDFINSIGFETLQYPDEDIDLAVLNMYLWRINGAENTIKDFQKMTKEKRKGLIDKIRDLPTHAEYVNKNGDLIYLCHAGRQPDTKEIHDMREGDIPMNNYIWDRRHIFDKTWRGKNNEYCVHGHTPVETMYYYVNLKINPPISQFKMYKYCEGHKINIDMGSFFNHYTCLLNLDTFEPIYFKDRTLTDKEWHKIYNGVK